MIEGENSNIFQVLTKTDSCPFHLTLLSRAAHNPCKNPSSWRYSFISHQTDQIHLTGLSSHGSSHLAPQRFSYCTHNMTWSRHHCPDINHMHSTLQTAASHFQFYQRCHFYCIIHHSVSFILQAVSPSKYFLEFWSLRTDLKLWKYHKGYFH